MTELETIKDDVNEMKEKQESTYKLAIKYLEQSNKRERFMVKCLLAIIGALLIINGYFAYVFTTTTVVEETYEQDGAYNLIDSENNMINSDYPIEVEHGEAKENN